MLVGKWPLKPYEGRLSQYLFSHRFTLFFFSTASKCRESNKHSVRWTKISERKLHHPDFLPNAAAQKTLSLNHPGTPFKVCWWFLSCYDESGSMSACEQLHTHLSPSPTLTQIYCQVGRGEGRFTTVQVFYVSIRCYKFFQDVKNRKFDSYQFWR